jgi:hypothetical protein
MTGHSNAIKSRTGMEAENAKALLAMRKQGCPSDP